MVAEFGILDAEKFESEPGTTRTVVEATRMVVETSRSVIGMTRMVVETFRSVIAMTRMVVETSLLVVERVFQILCNCTFL